MSDSRHLPLDQLDRQRAHAVRLRLLGRTLKEISAETGLSAPTVIAAHKHYLAGGWPAVAVKKRGRALGEGRSLPVAQEAELFGLQSSALPDHYGQTFLLWQLAAVQSLATDRLGLHLVTRTAGHYLQRWGLSAPKPAARLASAGASAQRWHAENYPAIQQRFQNENGALFWVDDTSVDVPGTERRIGLLRATTSRGKVRWMFYEGGLRAPHLITFFDRLIKESGCKIVVMLEGMQWQRAATFGAWLQTNSQQIQVYHLPQESGMASDARALASQMRPAPVVPASTPMAASGNDPMSAMLKHLMADSVQLCVQYSNKYTRPKENKMTLTHLQRLEAESIHAMREVVAEADNPVMLYSVGKDSAVMLHLAMKAFYPAKPPFKLLHVDTTWKFREMYSFRDQMVEKLGLDLLVHVNQEGVDMGISPFVHGSQIHTDIMKTQGLKQALDHYGFDVAFGGARRDEEKSRAKERIFSFRSAQHRWDPKAQRPELWHLYNVRKHKGESIRVFPLSNWTELDIWQYIYLENIPIVPLYFAKTRPVVERDGSLIMVDDERMPLNDGEVPMMRKVRFRTLGCYPLTGAIESSADTLPAIIQEMLLATTSERQGRVIDHDSAASMEKKKQEGYF